MNLLCVTADRSCKGAQNHTHAHKTMTQVYSSSQPNKPQYGIAVTGTNCMHEQLMSPKDTFANVADERYTSAHVEHSTQLIQKLLIRGVDQSSKGGPVVDPGQGPARYVSGTSSCLCTVLGFVCSATWQPESQRVQVLLEYMYPYHDKANPSLPSFHYTAAWALFGYVLDCEAQACSDSNARDKTAGLTRHPVRSHPNLHSEPFASSFGFQMIAIAGLNAALPAGKCCQFRRPKRFVVHCKDTQQAMLLAHPAHRQPSCYIRLQAPVALAICRTLIVFTRVPACRQICQPSIRSMRGSGATMTSILA